MLWVLGVPGDFFFNVAKEDCDRVSLGRARPWAVSSFVANIACWLQTWEDWRAHASTVGDPMLLIGVNRSPYTRRVAVTLEIYGISYEQRPLSSFDNRAEVRDYNPLGRIPTLVLDGGEALIDSGAIIDHLDEAYGRERALTPSSGSERRAVLRIAAIAMGACDKLLQAAYERSRRPPEKVHEPWRDDCIAQATSALAAIDALAKSQVNYLVLEKLSQADVCAFVAERLARMGLGIDTDAQMPYLRALTQRLATEPAFRSTEP
jgi:glutathione S-transferase